MAVITHSNTWSAEFERRYLEAGIAIPEALLLHLGASTEIEKVSS